MKFTLDGKLLASTGKDMTVRTWNVLSGKQINLLSGHKD
jgi:WD40 repeat protein